MENQYFVRQGARVSGPFSAEAVRKLAACGGLASNDEVSQDARTWSMAGSMAGLQFGGAAPIARPYYVFISYSAEDKRDADAICATLEAAGIPCWIAPRDILPGSEFGEGINEGLDQCRIVVLVFSEHANNSSGVLRQIERATSNQRKVIPFRVQNVLPTRSLKFFLSNTQWFDAFDAPLQQCAEELVAVVRRVVRKEEIDSAGELKKTPLGANSPDSGDPEVRGKAGGSRSLPASSITAWPMLPAKMALFVSHAASSLRRTAVQNPAIAVVVIALLAMLAIAPFYLTSSAGTIVLKVSPPSAEIFIDGGKADISWNPDGSVAELRAQPGTHKLLTRKDGYTTTDVEVVVRRGQREVVDVTLRPVIVPKPRPPHGDGPAPTPNRRDNRTRWVGEGGRRFVKTGDKLWSEQDANGRQRFTCDEISSTTSYVEIRRNGSKLHIRLFDGYIEFKAKNRQWERIENGKRHPTLLPMHGSWQ